MLRLMNYVAFVLALGAALPIGAARAQEKQEPIVTKVIGLQHLKVGEAVELVNRMYAGELYSVSGVECTNRVVMRGEEAVVKSAADLLTEVDVEGSSQEWHEEMTEYLPVQAYPMDKLMPLILGLNVDVDHLNVAVDHMNRQLVLTGTSEEIKAVRGLLAQVDRPERTLGLHFFFIRGVGEGFSWHPDAARLPEALAPVARALAEIGFGLPHLMGLLTVRANSTEEFKSSWAQGEQDPEAEGLQFNVTGLAQMLHGSDTVALDVRAQMRGRPTKRNQPLAATFELETTLSVKLDKYVVLAAAPSTTEGGSAIALAVRVTQD